MENDKRLLKALMSVFLRVIMVILDAPNGGDNDGGDDRFSQPPKAAASAPQPPQTTRCQLERLNVTGPFLFGNLDAVTLSPRYPKKLSVAMPKEEYLALRATVTTKVRQLFSKFVDHSSVTASVTPIEMPIYAAMGVQRGFLMKRADEEFLEFIAGLNNGLSCRNIRILVQGVPSSQFVTGARISPGPVTRQLLIEAPVPLPKQSTLYK